MWKKTVTPRFGDVDGLRHINNCMTPVWFELAREPLYRFFHPDLNLEKWELIIARITVDYVAQMRLGSDIEIRTWVKKVGRSSFTIYQEAWQDGQLGSKGEAVLVHYDFVNLKSLPIPEDVAAAMMQHLVDPDNPNLRSRSGRLPNVGRG
jgi:Predicted thioesterase